MLAAVGLLALSGAAFAADQTLPSLGAEIIDVMLTLDGVAPNACSVDDMGATASDSSRTGCTEGMTAYKAGEDPLVKVKVEFKAKHTDTTVEPKLLEVTKAQVKLCFSNTSKVDRPWRKYKAAIKKDKQCLKEIKEVAWSYDSTGEVMWSVKSPTPKAVYFIRVFGRAEDGTYLMYGDNDGQFVQVDGYDGLEPGIVAGAAVLSILAWAILAGYFIYTIFFVKSE